MSPREAATLGRFGLSYLVPIQRLKKLLKPKRLRVSSIKFLYKMSGNAMICQVLEAFSLVLDRSCFPNCYSVVVFNDLR